MKTASSFITGCHWRLRLVSEEQPFRVHPEDCDKCLIGAMATVDSHVAAMTTCQHCEHSTGPAYIEAGVPWSYEAEEPVELATEVPVKGSKKANNPWEDVDHYDPDKWASPSVAGSADVVKPEQTLRPPPEEPEGDPPDPEKAAADLPQAKVEEERPKEPLVTTPDVLAVDAPAQTPAAMPPPYMTYAQRPPPDIEVGFGDLTPTPDELVKLYAAGNRGGASLFGWSKLSKGLLCLRYFFYDFVARLSIKRRPERDFGEKQQKQWLNPLWLGGMMHDVRGLHLTTGGIHTWDPLYAVRGLHPEHALEAYRLMKHYLTQWGPSDNQKWDVRAVEVESRHYYKARRLGGKARRLCVSSRHDALIHPTGQGGLRYPVGQPAPKIDINEFKSARMISPIESFRVDGQALMHCGTYKYGLAVAQDGDRPEDCTVLTKSSEELYGRLNGITYDWVVKAKTFIPSKHLQRQQYIVPEDQVQHFLASVGEFLYEEIGKRLWHKKWQEPETWPQRWHCRGMYYPTWVCPFARICENVIRDTKTIDAQYDVGEPLDRSTLELPKKRKKRKSYKRKRAAADVEGK